MRAPALRSVLLGLAAAASVHAAAAAAATAPAALAFESGETSVGCLQPGPGAVEYPSDRADHKMGGTYRVRLIFFSPTEPPRADITYGPADPAFRGAVLQRVSSYRLPCLAPGAASVEAVQEFQFVPGDGRKVYWSDVHDDEPARGDTFCVTGMDRPPSFGRATGSVIAMLRFTTADQPPAVDIPYDSSGGQLTRSVRDAVARYRMPCLAAGAKPVVARQMFRFAWSDDRRTVLKDAPLSVFLGAVADLGRQPVRFDFATMQCPFDVRLVFFRPYATNEVGEVGGRQPDRREFIEWLKRIDLKLSPEQRAQVIGDSMTISVPCGVLDLT